MIVGVIDVYFHLANDVAVTSSTLNFIHHILSYEEVLQAEKHHIG
jgi:hypothetical protein